MFHRTRLNIRPDTWGKYSNVRISEEGDVAVQSGFWKIMRFVFYPGPVPLNFRAGIWHGICSLFIIILWGVKDPPFKLAFNKMWAKQTVFPDFLYSTECCDNTTGTPVCEDYADKGVMEWFDCIRPQSDEWRNYNSANDIQTYAPAVNEADGLGKIEVAGLLLLFELLTAGFHFFLWYNGELYERRLKEQFQCYRWIEYSITASIMLLCAVSLSRVQDQFLLISLFLNSFSLNFVGGCCFEVFYLAQRKMSGDADFETILRRLKWTCFWISWTFYAINLWTTWDAFYSVIQPYFDLPTEVFWRELFELAEYANIGITVTFTFFPLIHLYQFVPTMFPSWNRSEEGQIQAYRNGEIGFIWASFVSKTTLVVLFGFASFNRDDE